MENKGGSEISEIRVQPGSRSHGFTLSPTMAARSYMGWEGEGQRGQLGGGPQATLGPGLQDWFVDL